jgi:hypothetical protein
MLEDQLEQMSQITEEGSDLSGFDDKQPLVVKEKEKKKEKREKREKKEKKERREKIEMDLAEPRPRRET